MFEAREDAFQQLVGDALRAWFGHWITVAPTLGRDGAIDAWVDARSPVRLFDLPLIVECKDHDEQRPAYLENVQQGWQKVRRKLLKQAQSGWPGNYAPWRAATGYLYCISATLPNAQANVDLKQQICDFFAGLPVDQRPPLQEVLVVDWSSLRNWLDALDCENPNAAGFNVPPLLALADRLENVGLANEIVAVVLAVLNQPRLGRRARDGIAGAAYRLLADGAWADPIGGARSLAGLGLRRPARRPGDR